MLNELLNNDKFALLMKMHVYECIDFLLQNGIDFGIVANLNLTKFQPTLPDEISKNFSQPAIVFMLAGYTFESAKLTQDELSFEAGFGLQDYASVVSVPLGGIVQVMVEDSAVLINFSVPKIKEKPEQKSILRFKSNPKNQEICNKKS
ncbi:hypothetical protein [Campylobacter mucosalis]|uniref:Stringent starvation protein B n=1 Tax=Campylobacter mucosalis CCUG 21559 TaxID=1032067 RepID=A0A6G5QI16_9BACT|nr:hypothetical protein [Campylobacter mucosalis]KEA45552.1 hypothetical protein CR66_06890 [Campylobacter mucosalis]QCD45335.1 hypothetical protein CMUC_1585 [Campylobacter mucosalis CCUG 21559]QKF63247.1 hypothetical protein CMCT_1123 [Campylobacter mucosalis]